MQINIGCGHSHFLFSHLSFSIHHAFKMHKRSLSHGMLNLFFFFSHRLAEEGLVDTTDGKFKVLRRHGPVVLPAAAGVGSNPNGSMAALPGCRDAPIVIGSPSPSREPSQSKYAPPHSTGALFNKHVIHDNNRS